MATPKYEDVLARLRSEYMHSAGQEFDIAIQPNQSPIEKVFAAQLVTQWGWVQSHNLPYRSSCAVTDMLTEAGIVLPEALEDLVDMMILGGVGEDHVACVAQGTIHLSDRHVRPDFAFVLRTPDERHRRANTKIVVELDGHDFHERTPDQAQRDKSRDRELQALGWQVLRFTGREVLRDPFRCVKETASLLVAKWTLALREQP